MPSRGCAGSPIGVCILRFVAGGYQDGEADARRYESLVKTGDISPSNYERQATQAKTARARANTLLKQYETALNKVRQNYQAIASAQASLAAARVQLALAQKAVDDTIIRPGALSDNACEGLLDKHFAQSIMLSLLSSGLTRYRSDENLLGGFYPEIGGLHGGRIQEEPR